MQFYFNIKRWECSNKSECTHGVTVVFLALVGASPSNTSLYFNLSTEILVLVYL